MDPLTLILVGGAALLFYSSSKKKKAAAAKDKPPVTPKEPPGGEVTDPVEPPPKPKPGKKEPSFTPDLAREKAFAKAAANAHFAGELPNSIDGHVKGGKTDLDWVSNAAYWQTYPDQPKTIGSVKAQFPGYYSKLAKAWLRIRAEAKKVFAAVLGTPKDYKVYPEGAKGAAPNTKYATKTDNSGSCNWVTIGNGWWGSLDDYADESVAGTGMDNVNDEPITQGIQIASNAMGNFFPMCQWGQNQELQDALLARIKKRPGVTF